MQANCGTQNLGLSISGEPPWNGGTGVLIALPPLTLIGVALGVIVDFVSLVSLRMVCARAILARKSAEMPLSSSKRVKRRREAVGQQQSRRKNGDRLGGRVSDALGRTFALDIRGRWRSC